MCLKRDLAAPRDRREIQANKGMAALLMSRSVFRKVASAEFARAGIEPKEITRTDTEAAQVAEAIGVRFQTSRLATLIRLETQGFLKKGQQTGLSLRG